VSEIAKDTTINVLTIFLDIIFLICMDPK